MRSTAWQNVSLMPMPAVGAAVNGGKVVGHTDGARVSVGFSVGANEKEGGRKIKVGLSVNSSNVGLPVVGVVVTVGTVVGALLFGAPVGATDAGDPVLGTCVGLAD